MRRIEKKADSDILKQNLQYSKATQRPAILEILETEQNRFCAYTEDRFTATYAPEVEHFNPTLKNTPQDSYENWFAVGAKFNKMKGTSNAIPRWNDFQPLLSPTASDLEQRVLYVGGDYVARVNDIEAKNLIDYLNLTDEGLVADRKKHIAWINFLLDALGNDIDKLADKLKEFIEQVKFPRAILEEFGIRL